MWVKIKKAKQSTYWYANRIGEKFEVKESEDYKWGVINSICRIDKEDCVEIKEKVTVMPLGQNKKGDKKHLLYLGCNYCEEPEINIQWIERGRGKGSYCFQVIGNKIFCINEGDSKETIKRMLNIMVDQAILTS